MPNNYDNNQHCVQFYVSSVRWGPSDAWNDYDCNHNAHNARFICEKVKSKE